MATFEPSEYTTLRWADLDVCWATGTISMSYELSSDSSVAPAHAFTETVSLEALKGAPGSVRGAIRRAATLLWLAAGVSYYKVANPRRVQVPALSPPVQRWFEALYTEGLAEYRYRNGLDVAATPVIEFTADTTLEAVNEEPMPQVSPASGRALVAVGGGKDSCVAAERARAAGVAFSLFSMGGGAIAHAMADAAGVDLVVGKRSLDRHMIELNSQGALNGHIPITAINSLCGVIAALCGGYDFVMFANEHSASEAAFVYNGVAVNHQFSKSLEAEQMLRDCLHAGGIGIDYFSAIRDSNELRVAREFAELAQYHDIFMSCNKNFSLSGKQDIGWCKDCPKCDFVFLILAPFMAKERLVEIFGGNPLDDPGQLATYRELANFEGFKPFECVGEYAECRAALGELATLDQWREDAVVAALATELAGHANVSVAEYAGAVHPTLAPAWCEPR